MSQQKTNRRSSSLYDSEAGSDVTFLVGCEPESWRIPGHSWILAASNPVFNAMFNGPLAVKDKSVVISDVDGRAFDILLRFLYKEPVSLQSIATALATLYAAHKYLCPGLAALAVNYLAKNLSEKNVLRVFHHVRLYCCDAELMQVEKPVTPFPTSSLTSGTDSKTGDVDSPSAPPAESVFETDWSCRSYEQVKHNCSSKSSSHSDYSHIPATTAVPSHGVHLDISPTNCCVPLLKICLEMVDEHADFILATEDIEDLDINALKAIAQRESLALSSESILFGALLRWSNRECKRQKMEMTPENRRSVLDEAQYLVRYLMMTSQEFLQDPVRSGLLTNEEEAAIMGHILGHNSPPFPDHLLEWFTTMRTPRCGTKPTKPGVGVVVRTYTHCGNLKALRKSKKTKKEKEKEKEMKRNSALKKQESCERKGCNFVEELFICLACLFD